MGHTSIFGFTNKQPRSVTHSFGWHFLSFVSIFQKQDEGVVLLDQVCNHLGLQERQLFSLQIRESNTAVAAVTANTHSPVSSLFICCTLGKSYFFSRTH